MTENSQPRPPLAYKNDDFLKGPDARVLRIISEYLEPLSHLRRQRIRDTIVFFGSARIREEGPLAGYYRDARTLAAMLTTWAKTLREQNLPLRSVHRRRTRHHGSRQPRGLRCKRKNHRPQYRPPVRAVSQSVHHARTQFRVPLLLHAEVLVRVHVEGAGSVSGRIRNARRAVRDSDSCADAQDREEDHHRAVWVGFLEGDPELRRSGEVRHHFRR